MGAIESRSSIGFRTKHHRPSQVLASPAGFVVGKEKREGERDRGKVLIWSNSWYTGYKIGRRTFPKPNEKPSDSLYG